MAIQHGSKRLVVGAHYGLRDWLAQRITAVLMLLLMMFGLGWENWLRLFVWLAIGLVIVLIGFLRMRRWSWVMLMTWVGISMVVGLVDYFYFGQPNYVIMASDVVIAFALSQAEVQRIFGIRTDISELLS